MSTTLPTTPSALLRTAMADLKSVEADPRYYVNMGVWHEMSPRTGLCHVCLAGAVMAKSLNFSPTEDIQPAGFNDTVYAQLHALNALRLGEINFALHHLDIEPPKALPVRIGVSSYEQNRLQFHADMEALATLLQEHGL